MNSPINDRIADAILRIATLTRAQETLQGQTEGLSPLQARALVAPRRRRELRVGALAKELCVTTGTLSAAVTTLEAKGLIIKRADPVEHRAVKLALTRRGAAAARRAEGWAGALLAEPVGELPAETSADLLAGLLELLRAFERRGAIAATRMCLTCRHFERDGGQGERPHYCHLLEAAIGAADLRVDCPEHEPGALAS